MKNKLIEILQAMGRVAFINDEKADYLLEHDVVPVVKCKDCRYWDNQGYRGYCEAPENGLVREYTSEDDFCSYGERGASK